MQSGRRYGLFHLIRWTRKYLMIFVALGCVPVALRQLLGWTQLRVPWIPIALIGTAVAFYLGFKNNSSYERLWEARKIWGGIVNASRAWAVCVRDFVTDLHATEDVSPAVLAGWHRKLVMRHIAWVHALALQLREARDWEHCGAEDVALRLSLDTLVTPESYDALEAFVDAREFAEVRAKKNTAVHLLSRQSDSLRELRKREYIDDFRHMEMQKLITELYALQGKCERIKNFPFPRQYATVNLVFVWLFIGLVPFGLVDLFAEMGEAFVWLTVPFTTLVAWVFHTMEMIGDYSENPFEGTYNDVPIRTMAVGIEIDLRQLIDDEKLPVPLEPIGEMRLSV